MNKGGIVWNRVEKYSRTDFCDNCYANNFLSFIIHVAYGNQYNIMMCGACCHRLYLYQCLGHNRGRYSICNSIFSIRSNW